MVKCQGHWHIHGKCYDLSKGGMMDWHPGGRTILELVRDDDDATATFESYHVFAPSKAAILRRLADHEIPPCGAAAQPPSFESTGLYAVLGRRVAAALGSQRKATPGWWAKVCLGLAGLCLGWWWLLVSGSVLAGCWLGLCQWIVAYSALHDGCHYAVFHRNPNANLRLSAVCCAVLNLWHPHRWLYHHAVRHHAFTGDDTHDPDRRHLTPFIDKRTPHLHRTSLFVCITVLFPGLWFGQALSYLGWWGRNRLWGMKGIRDPYVPWIALGWALRLGTAWCNPVGSLLWAGTANLIYALTILPDHDTRTTARNSAVRHTRDWGEAQVRHSANFGGRVCFNLFGGINYQIEHHLFPGLNHMYYPTIAPIVQQTCAEFGVPYVHFPTVASAFYDCLQCFHRG